jgi:hypothetical protein
LLIERLERSENFAEPHADELLVARVDRLHGFQFGDELIVDRAWPATPLRDRARFVFTQELRGVELLVDVLERVQPAGDAGGRAATLAVVAVRAAELHEEEDGDQREDGDVAEDRCVRSSCGHGFLLLYVEAGEIPLAMRPTSLSAYMRVGGVAALLQLRGEHERIVGRRHRRRVVFRFREQLACAIEAFADGEEVAEARVESARQCRPCRTRSSRTRSTSRPRAP